MSEIALYEVSKQLLNQSTNVRFSPKHKCPDFNFKNSIIVFIFLK